MMGDARRTNVAHRDPPRVAIGSAAAVCELDWSPGAPGRHEDGLAPALFAGGLDPAGGFFQFSVPQLSSWFALNFAERASAYGCCTVFNESAMTEEPVGRDVYVFPVMQVLDMGWSLALFFCHSMLIQSMIGAGLGDPHELAASVLRERAPSPIPTEEYPVMAPYVYNANILGLSERGVDAVLDRLKRRLDELGVKYQYVLAATQSYECLGVEIDGASLAMRLKPLYLLASDDLECFALFFGRAAA